MLVDLDRFKLVNDSLGHAAGDDVLIGVAKRLSDTVRPTDVLGRLHGDEFALYLRTSGEAELLSAIAERAQQILRAPFVFDGQPVFIDSSIGICIAQGDVRPGRHAPQRRYRHVQSEADGPRTLRLLQRGDERSVDALDAARIRSAARPRARRVPRRVSADRRTRRRDDPRVRSARALGPSRTRSDRADRIHPDRRGDGRDRPTRAFRSWPKPAARSHAGIGNIADPVQ